jgi:hypothetical protein
MRLNTIQYAYVTRNLDKALDSLSAKYGYENFIRFDPDIEVKTPGGTGRMQSRVAMTWDGGTQIEIIQPVSGLVDLYLPYLPEDDSMRFHHSAARIDDWPAFKAEFERKNCTVALASGLEGMEFVYLDERATLGHYVEYLWATPEWWKAMGLPDAA